MSSLNHLSLFQLTDSGLQGPGAGGLQGPGAGACNSVVSDENGRMQEKGEPHGEMENKGR